MKRQLITGLLVLLSFWGCKKYMESPDDCSYYDYNDCNTTEPQVTDATFKFTLNGQIGYVPFVIYKGDIEDDFPLYYDTAYSSMVYYYLDFDYTMAVTVEHYSCLNHLESQLLNLKT